MDLQFSETDTLLRSSAQKLFEERVTLGAKLELDHDGHASTFDQELWREFGELGWLSAACAPDPEAAVVLGILAEEVGRSGCATPFLRAATAALTLARHGEGAVTKRLLEQAALGTQILIPVGIEPGQKTILAEQDGKDFYVAFDRRLVEWAPSATGFIVMAWRPDGRPLLVHFDHDAPGLEIEPVETFDNAAAAWVSLQRIAVSGDAVVGSPESLENIDETIALTQLLSAAEAVGGAEGALDLVVNHVREREQFGRKIGAFQSIQHGLADVKILVDGASLAVWSALSDASLDRSCVGSAALATWLAQRAFQETAVKGALYHGGMGHTRDSHMQFLYRRAGTSHARLGTQWDLLGTISDFYIAPNLDRVTD